MAVRVKIRLRAGNREEVTSALVNTGFESPAPDVAVSTAVAKALAYGPPQGLGLSQQTQAATSFRSWEDMKCPLRYTVSQRGSRIWASLLRSLCLDV